MTKVAVITRTKDRPIFLRRALDSVAAQTFDDYIHVVVNDGGNKDKVNEAIEGLPESAKNKIKVFHRDKPSNAPDTIFNESVNRVESVYFAFHDDDDTWDKDFLMLMVQRLDDKPELGAAVARANNIEEVVEGNTIRQLKVMQWQPDIKVINLYRQCIENQISAGLTLYRRSSYLEAGKFDDSLPVVGDWEFGLRLLMKYEVELVDPGHAIANYHHRAYKPGVEGNSTFAGNESHRYYTNIVMNRYLREELNQGRLGVGYIMSQARYENARLSKLAKKMLPNFIANRLKNRIQS